MKSIQRFLGRFLIGLFVCFLVFFVANIAGLTIYLRVLYDTHEGDEDFSPTWAVRDTVEGETPAAAATSLMVTAMICSSRIDIASIVKPFARNVNVCAKSCANRAMRHSAYLRQLSQRIFCCVVENVESLFLP